MMMKLSLNPALLAAFLAVIPSATATALPRATPESQGIDSTALVSLIDEAEARKFGLHSLMIVRHGRVVAEGWWAPFAAAEPHMLFSLSKSFTSTAIGLLQAEGRIDIHDPVLKYFPDDAPAEPSANLRAMRIRDLLMMSTGQHKEDVDAINVNAADGSGVRQFLAAPVRQKPGTLFYYNSPATFMLSAIVQKVTGQTTRDYLVPRLFTPLGIPTPDWDLTPPGIALGASGLHLRTEAVARFGQLLLQRGEWEGRRLLPAEWIDLATSRQVSNGSNPDSDWEQGYGFQFWRCVPGFYRADGAFGQYCIVMPQHDTVIAINSGSRDMGGIMKLLWNRLLPELRPAALPENETAHAQLSERLANLSYPTQLGAATSPLGAGLSGRRFAIPAGDGNPTGLESIGLDVDADGAVTVVTTRRGQSHRLAAGRQRWIKDSVPLGPGEPQPVAVSGAWTADNTYTFQIYRYRTPFIITMKLTFAGDTVTVEPSQNVGFGPTQLPVLTGTAR